MTKTTYAIFFLTAIFFSGCDPDEQLAGYLHIEPFEYTAGDDGIHSSKITDGWIYVDNEFVGAFDLPKTIPVLKIGQVSVVIDPGIRENGISALPEIYTFYKRFTVTVNIEPGETTTISPGTTYDDEKTNIVFQEDFEESPHQFNVDIDGNTATKVDIIDTDVKEGTGAGKISLSRLNPTFVGGSQPTEDPPGIGPVAFIELDYKTDVPLFVGLIGRGNAGEMLFSEVNLGVNPKSEWNKIYFNVSDKLEQLYLVGAVNYQIAIQAQIPRENGEFTMENAEIYLDNIKLIVY